MTPTAEGNIVVRTVLIATLPKSGTWYSKTFFWFYGKLLQNAEAFQRGDYWPNLADELAQLRASCTSPNSAMLGIDHLYIAHMLCPGFRKEMEDPLFEQWQALLLPDFAYNSGEWQIRDTGVWDTLDLRTNGDIRIVYLCRNPLDHFVSYYRHIRSHVDNRYRSRITTDGRLVPIENIHDFIFNANGLSGFIKHYYAFRQMQRRFPKHVMIVPYEKLVGGPQLAFSSILSFVGASPETEVQQSLFQAALNMSSKDSLMRLESRLNGSLSGDHIGGGRHIRDGSTGQWKQHLSVRDIQRIEAILNLFDITLNEFRLHADSSEDVSDCFAMDDRARQQYQIMFLRQQLALSGAGIATELNKVHESKSWRAMAPLRAMGRIVRRA